MNDESDPVLLAKIMKEVRIDLVQPMLIKVTKFIQGRAINSHIFEYALCTSVAEVQKDVGLIVSKWRGGFEVGVQFTIERIR